MGYLLLFLAVFAGATKGYCGKRISDKIKSLGDCAEMSMVRMLFCCLVSVAVVFTEGNFTQFGFDPVSGGIYLLSGISMAVFIISWTLAVRTSAYMLVNIFVTSALIINMLFGFFLFDERLDIFQIVGIVLIVAAIVFLISYNEKLNCKLTVKQFLLLIVMMLGQGFSNLSQKLFVVYVDNGSKSVYNFYTFLITLAALIILRAVLKQKGEAFSGKKYKDEKYYTYIAVMAIMLFANSYFLTFAAEKVQSVILYPLNSVLGLATSTVMAVCFFKEKLNRNGIIGIILTVVALLFTTGTVKYILQLFGMGV